MNLNLVIVIFLLIFLPIDKSYGRNLATYTEQATIVAHWLMRSTSHQPLNSATPLALRQDLRQHKKTNKYFQHKSQFGLSSMQADTSDEVQNAYDYFELGAPAPSELNLLRVHYTKSMGDKMDFGISYLQVPNISMQGQGAHFSLNIFKLKNFYTTARIQHSWVKKIDFFKASTTALELLQSWNTSNFDVYIGAKYYYGKTHFYSKSKGGPIPTIDYQSSTSEIEKLIGFSKMIYKNFQFDGQIKTTKDEKSFLGKISFTLPQFKYRDGEWRLPTIN